MQAADIMTTNVVTVLRDTPVAEIARLLLQHRISAVPVIDSECRVIGIVSEGDLMRRPESQTETRHSWWLETFLSKREKAAEYIKAHGRKAADVMSTNVVTATEEMTPREVAQLLEAHHVKRVPVVRDGRLVGIISRANLLHGLVATGAESAAPASVDDRAIRQELVRVLGVEVGLNTSIINVVVTGGTVSLWGIVDSQAEKDAAQIAAEQITGVESVNNNLNQLPTWIWVS